MDWYPFYPLKYRADTMCLSLAEHGAYRLLIDHYMMTEKPLPADDHALARIVGATPREWSRISHRIRGFFAETDDGLHHKRCDEELALQRQRSTRARENANRRYRKPNGEDHREDDSWTC